MDALRSLIHSHPAVLWLVILGSFAGIGWSLYVFYCSYLGWQAAQQAAAEEQRRAARRPSLRARAAADEKRDQAPPQQENLLTSLAAAQARAKAAEAKPAAPEGYVVSPRSPTRRDLPRFKPASPEAAEAAEAPTERTPAKDPLASVHAAIRDAVGESLHGRDHSTAGGESAEAAAPAPVAETPPPQRHATAEAMARRHEELGLHIGIAAAAPDASISDADKQNRLAQLGLAPAAEGAKPRMATAQLDSILDRLDKALDQAAAAAPNATATPPSAASTPPAADGADPRRSLTQRLNDLFGQDEAAAKPDAAGAETRPQDLPQRSDDVAVEATPPGAHPVLPPRPRKREHSDVYTPDDSRNLPVGTGDPAEAAADDAKTAPLAKAVEPLPSTAILPPKPDPRDKTTKKVPPVPPSTVTPPAETTTPAPAAAVAAETAPPAAAAEPPPAPPAKDKVPAWARADTMDDEVKAPSKKPDEPKQHNLFE